MRNTMYRLQLRVEIQELDDRGAYNGRGLSVEQHRDLGAMDFFEIAQTLGRFHELAAEIEMEGKSA